MYNGPTKGVIKSTLIEAGVKHYFVMEIQVMYVKARGVGYIY